MSTPFSCPCPQGTVSDGNGNCVQTTISTPTLSSTIYTVSQGTQNNHVYNSHGVNVYQDITNNVLPVVVASGGTSLQDSAGTAISVANAFGYGAPNFWGGYSALPPGYYGRLNNCGVWTTLTATGVSSPCGGYAPGVSRLPLCEWIGFTECITVPTTGTYWLGVSADNDVRIKINGQTVVSLVGGQPFNFYYFHVFPITLTAGINVISFEGFNYISDASFAAEIYTAAPTSAISTQAALTAITLFSTANKIGQTFDSGQFSGYICPTDTCQLSLCNGTPKCTCLISSPAPQCCFKLTNCITGGVIITSTDLSNSIGAVVNIAEQLGCWQVSSANTCTGSITVTLTQTYQNCPSCLPCYKFTNCANTSQVLNTNTDFSTYIGHVLEIERFPGVCWTVSASSNCTNTGNLVLVKDYGVGACATCLCQYYELVDCAGTAKTIITNTNLSAYLGQVIQIQGCVGVCYQVSCSNTTAGATPVVLTKSFATCLLCNPPVIPPTPELLHQRKVRPGYNTPGCSPEYSDKINCAFADQVYNEMVRRRYGVTVCCDRDIPYWAIKKELLDLAAIYDETLCRTCPPISCCTPCPIVPPPAPPTPVGCTAPINVTATLTIITPCLDVVPGVNAQIIFNNPKGNIPNC